jgi:hypothetical protein
MGRKWYMTHELIPISFIMKFSRRRRFTSCSDTEDTRVSEGFAASIFRVTQPRKPRDLRCHQP